MVAPPSTCNVCPVIFLASSDTKKTTARPMSSAVCSRPSGEFTVYLRQSSMGVIASISSLAKGGGRSRPLASRIALYCRRYSSEPCSLQDLSGTGPSKPGYSEARSWTIIESHSLCLWGHFLSPGVGSLRAEGRFTRVRLQMHTGHHAAIPFRRLRSSSASEIMLPMISFTGFTASIRPTT